MRKPVRQTPEGKTKVPEPSGKPDWKTGFVLHCPNPQSRS